MHTPTKFEAVLSAAAAWAAEAAETLTQADSKLASMANAAVAQDWPLVVCVTINRMQADLCLVNPEGQMQPLVTAGMGARDARRAN